MAAGKQEQYAKLPYWIFQRGLCPWARLVYAVLLDEARGTGTVRIGLRRLATILDGDKNTIARAIADLDGAGLLEVVRGRNGQANTYRLTVRKAKSVPHAGTVVKQKASRPRDTDRPSDGTGCSTHGTLPSLREGHKTRQTEYREEPEATAPSKPRKRDPIWDVVEELWFSDGIPEHQRSRVGKWVQTFKDLNATADEIRVRHQRAIEWYERKRATVKAVIDHWSELKNGSNTGISRPGRVESSPGEYGAIKPFRVEG